MEFGLEGMLDLSVRLNSLKKDEKKLFEVVNRLPIETQSRIDEIVERYKNSLPAKNGSFNKKIRSANILRLAIAYKLKGKQPITSQLIQDLKGSFIDDARNFLNDNFGSYKINTGIKVSSHTFKHWDSDFKILFPFIISFSELKNTQEYLEKFTSRIIKELKLDDEYVATCYSFEGVTDKGDSDAWFSIYPKVLKPKKKNSTGHSLAFQFHCRISNGEISVGKYPGEDLPPALRQNFKEMKLVKDEKEIVSCFLSHKKSVIDSNRDYHELGLKEMIFSPNFKDLQNMATEECGELCAEGEKVKVSTSKILKNLDLMEQCKVQDDFKCRACNFSYEKSIVHAHHMIPFVEKVGQRIPKLDELITLCPTCHAIAHNILRNHSDKKFRNDPKALIDKINIIRHSSLKKT